MYPKYTSEVTKEKYDAIIIGSGIGGLTTASILAKFGKKVLVLERHYVPGGFSHTFKRKDGFEWDVGVHYIGKVDSDESLLRLTFDYITDGKLQWAGMGDIYDKAIINGDEYDFVCGVEDQIQNLIGHFPDEERAIKKYYKLVKKVSDGSGLFFGEKTMPGWLSSFIGWMLRRRFNKYSDRTTYETLRELTDNEKLISVLCTQCGNYGLSPKKSSFGIHAIIVDHYIYGGNYPVGSAANIYRYIVEDIVKNGGQVLIKAEVDKVLVKENMAVGVIMANGDQILADKVISNTGAHNTFEKLMPDNVEVPANILQDLKDVKPSTSHICLYVGLDASDKELNLPKWNYWVYADYDFEGGYEEHISNPHFEPPLAYISFPSAKDPAWEVKNPNKATIQVLGIASYEWFKQWTDTRWRKRGKEYEQFVDKFKEGLLNKLYEIVPQVKGHVVIAEISSPLSTKHFTNYKTGEIYGMEHTPRRFRLRWLRSQTFIKNFYITGQDLITVGVGGAMMAGLITSIVILRRYVIGKILKYNKSQ